MTVEATGRAPAGDAGFRLLAEHLPDLILLAFDDDLRIWARPAGSPPPARPTRRGCGRSPRIARVGSWERDLVSDEMVVSDEFDRIFGYPPGSGWTMKEAIRRLIPQVVALDGTVRTLLARGEGVVDGDGRVVPFIGTTQDITDRRRAEAERRSEEGVVLRVSDDGRGFDPDHVQVLADIAHFGLIAMRERVEARLPPTDPTEGVRL